jgi:tetratricopeptide (TPR) repeat protein
MATDTALVPPPLPPAAPAARPPAAPFDPTRHLWQLPVLLLGVGVFVSVWQGWLPLGSRDPRDAYKRDLIELKAAYEKVTPDVAVLKERLPQIVKRVDEYRDLAPLAHFYLGSGYVRLAELTGDPEEARGYWTLAHQHFGLTSDKQLGDPADAAKYAFRANKAKAVVGLPRDTSNADLDLLIKILQTPQSSEDTGETQRIIAELALRQGNFDLAKLALTQYVQSGISTPAASLARGRLQLGRVYVHFSNWPDARKVLSEIGEDVPVDVLGPAKAELAKVLMSDGDFAKAAEELDRLRAAPGVPPALRLHAAYQLALCKLKPGPVRDRDGAVRLFQEVVKGDGAEARAAAVKLADLHASDQDKARHKEAVELLAGAFKSIGVWTEADKDLIPLNVLQGTFEVVVLALLRDGEYELALRAADLYSPVAVAGRDRDLRADVLGQWGDALARTRSPDDAKPKFRDAAAEYVKRAAEPPAPGSNEALPKLDALRRAASYYRKAGDNKDAAAQLASAVRLAPIPEQILVPTLVELVDAKLAANEFNDVLPIFNEIMARPGALSTATRYRLARQFVEMRQPEMMRLGRYMFEQIATKTTIESGEREFHERSITELANALIREGQFADAENRLRGQLTLYPKGPEAGMARLLLGVCLLQRAAAPGMEPAEALKIRTEALGLFKENVNACDNAERHNGQLTESEKYLRLQSSLRVLQAYQVMRTNKSPTFLLIEAAPLLDRYRGTVDELIILSLIYHAYKQLNDTPRAQEIRDRMKDAFDKLPPSAFTRQSGEYSRDYWLNLWFPPERKP